MLKNARANGDVPEWLFKQQTFSLIGKFGVIINNNTLLLILYIRIYLSLINDKYMKLIVARWDDSEYRRNAC